MLRFGTMQTNVTGTPNCSVSDRKLLETLDKSVDKVFLLFLGFLAIMLIIAVLAFG